MVAVVVTAAVAADEAMQYSKYGGLQFIPRR
jgi:hypothetical protein